MDFLYLQECAVYFYVSLYVVDQVCFREVMFPMLARQRLGLYYNMPVVSP